MLKKRIVRLCGFSTSYIPGNQQITLLSRLRISVNPWSCTLRKIHGSNRMRHKTIELFSQKKQGCVIEKIRHTLVFV